MKQDDFKRALSAAGKNLPRKYVCKADGYTVTYDPLERVAKYDFNGKEIIIKDFYQERVNNLLKSGYWV